MKQFVYVTYDPGLKVYDQPFFVPIAPDHIKEQYRRQFFHDGSKAYANFLDCKDLYILGTYDEELGDIALDKRFLFAIKEILPLPEVDADGKIKRN